MEASGSEHYERSLSRQHQGSDWQQQELQQQALSYQQQSPQLEHEQQQKQQQFMPQQHLQPYRMQSASQQAQPFTSQRSLRQQVLQELLNPSSQPEQEEDNANDEYSSSLLAQDHRDQPDWASAPYQNELILSPNDSRDQQQQQQQQRLAHRQSHGWVSLRQEFEPGFSWESEAEPVQRTASNPMFEASTWHDVIDLTQQDAGSSASGENTGLCSLLQACLVAIPQILLVCFGCCYHDTCKFHTALEECIAYSTACRGWVQLLPIVLCKIM